MLIVDYKRQVCQKKFICQCVIKYHFRNFITEKDYTFLRTLLPKKTGEGPRNVTRPIVEQNILDAVSNKPTNSVRKISVQFNISKTTVHKILEEQLLLPFHIQEVHTMTVQDYSAGLEYTRWFINKQGIIFLLE